MRYVVCSIRDIVGNLWGQPYYMPSTGMAIRNFSDTVNAKAVEQNLIAAHPSDFELFQLGFFDDQTGRFDIADVPTQLIAGKQCVVTST